MDIPRSSIRTRTRPSACTNETPNPAGGSYDKDDEGNLNGIVQGMVPAITPFAVSLFFVEQP